MREAPDPVRTNACEARGSQILVSSRTAAAVEDLVEAEEVGTLTLKGLHKPVPAINVTGLKTT